MHEEWVGVQYTPFKYQVEMEYTDFTTKFCKMCSWFIVYYSL